MSRYANHGSSASNVALAVVNSHLEKKETVDGCRTNHDLLATVAERFIKGSLLEKTLLFLADDDAEEEKAEIEKFMSQGRREVKNIALHNAKQQRQQEAFKTSLRSLKTQILNKADQDGNQADGDGMDFEATLNELMTSELSKLEESKKDEDYDTYQEICEKAGIETNAQRVDDDIEFVGHEGGHQSATQDGIPRCPISQQEMVDPVKNTNCGHTYSREGIMSLLTQKNGRCPCPMGGCANKEVKADQLEDDTQMGIAINRARRRKQTMQEKLSQEAADVDESDEEM